MRIRHIENTLGSRRDGPMYASRDWVWRPQRHRRWGGAVSDVPSSDSRATSGQISQFGSRSAVSIPPMASQSSSTRCDGNQDGSLCAASHPFVERLIGTVRREYLDRTLFWTTADLETKLFNFQHYYNGHRTHAGLDGGLPALVAGSTSPIDFDSYG